MQPFLIRTVGLACATLASLASSAAHDLPYGQVERAIQITAYPGRIEVQYQFGLHERMLWEQLHGDEGSDAWETLDREALARLESDYLATVASELPTWIELQVGGELRECTGLTAELIYQHHLQFECRLDFACPSSADRTSLRLVDKSFWAFPGHYRVAVRGREGMEAISDTAALLLVRAPRLPILEEGRGQLVVPPIEATLGKGLGRGTPRLVESRVASEQGEGPGGQPSAVTVSDPLLEASVAEFRGESVGDDEVARTKEKPKRLPGWLLAGFIVLAVISCLPLLWHAGQAV